MTAGVISLAEHRERKAFDAWGVRYMQQVREEVAERFRRNSDPDGFQPWPDGFDPDPGGRAA